MKESKKSEKNQNLIRKIKIFTIKSYWNLEMSLLPPPFTGCTENTKQKWNIIIMIIY